jgi:hypothetical protein
VMFPLTFTLAQIKMQVEEADADCDPEAPLLGGWGKAKAVGQTARAGAKATAAKALCGVQSGASRASRFVVRGIRAVHAAASSHAPPTDAACLFTFDGLRCEPEDQCAFDFKWGDYTLGRR